MVFTCFPAGDLAISLQFAQDICPQINAQVLNVAHWIRETKIRGIVELVPAYASLLVYYNPLIINYQELIEQLNTYQAVDQLRFGQRRMVTIPALYGGEWGPDLENVAMQHGLSAEEVIRLHTSANYYVYMLGFSPGFPYLGGLPIELHTPRLATPRSLVQAGSIGIAGSQTGIYSLATPGGWRIIAHTPIPLFDLRNENEPFFLRAGDAIRFSSVNIEEYLGIIDQIKAATYVTNMITIEEERYDH